MYVFALESGHVVSKEQWYAFMLRVLLQTDLYMTWENQVFIIDVVVIDPSWETMASSVINQPIGVTAKLNAIVKPQV
jgi:hypothetical protein